VLPPERRADRVAATGDDHVATGPWTDASTSGLNSPGGIQPAATRVWNERGRRRAEVEHAGAAECWVVAAGAFAGGVR
jgi:hypothetical protein